MKIRKVYRLIGLTLVLFLSVMSANVLAAGHHKKFTLKLWSAWPDKMDPAKPGLQMLQDMINEKGKDYNISIVYKGGPEIFGPFQGCESVQKGIVDIAYTAAAYDTGVIPEADAMKLIETKPWKDRTNGIYDLMNQWYNEKSLQYMARSGSGQGFQGYLNKKVTEPDLSGLTMRIVPIYIPLINALGAKGVSTAGGEVYTALERGIVDGFWWGGREIRPWGWHEVCKYIWGPPFWTVDVYVFMNKKTWDSFDSEQQKFMFDLMGEYEKAAHDAQVELQDSITQNLVNSGMEIIEFSDKDEQWYLDMAYREGWKAALEKASRVSKLKELVEKNK